MAYFWGVIKGTLKAVRRWARTCCASCRAPASVAILILAGLCPLQRAFAEAWDDSEVNRALSDLQWIEINTSGLTAMYPQITGLYTNFVFRVYPLIQQIANDSRYYVGTNAYVTSAQATAQIQDQLRYFHTDVNRYLQQANNYLDDIFYYIENGLIGGGGGGGSDTNLLQNILVQLATEMQGDNQTLRGIVDDIAEIGLNNAYTNSYYWGEMITKVGQMNTTLNNLKTNSDNLKNTLSRCETILNSIKDSLTSDGKSVAEYEKLVWAYLTTTTPDGKSFKGSINDILAYCATNSIALQEISDQLSLNNYAMTNLSSVLEGLTTNLLANATNHYNQATNVTAILDGDISYLFYDSEYGLYLNQWADLSLYKTWLYGDNADVWSNFATVYNWGNFGPGVPNINSLLANLISFDALNNFWGTYNLINSIQPVLDDTRNTLTNKTESVPYTVIYPASVTASGGLPAIYPALTNAYINSWQQQSDMTWFDRIEALLAALVFESAANNQNTNGNENSWGLDAGGGGTGSIESSYGQYQTGVGGLQTLVGNYRSSAIGLLSNINSKFQGVSNNGIEWQTGIDNDYFAIDTSNPFFQVIRTCSIICWSCGFLFLIVKLFAIVSPFIFKGFKFAFNIVSALIMGG